MPRPNSIQWHPHTQVGDGLPDIVHTSVCTKALQDVGFEVQQRPLPGALNFVWCLRFNSEANPNLHLFLTQLIEARDVAQDQGFCIDAGDPW